MTNPLHPYVRFYASTVAQLDDVAAALARTAEETRTAVAPFADVLAASEDSEVRRAAEPAEPRPLTDALWRPQDPATLTGMVDVYDVVGRFTFQGEDDSNLAKLQAAVGAAVGEVKRQRLALAALADLPAAATRAAEGLSQQELAAADAARAERLKPFEPAADRLRDQCAKVLDAVRQVPRPDLSDLETADTLYGEYVRRIQALYGAGIPYLRRALQTLCDAASVDVPPSWPDTLPFAPHLPPELVAPPSAETTGMLGARSQIDGVEAQDAQLRAALENVVIAQQRAETERAGLAAREQELLAEVAWGKQLVRWATKLGELDATLQAIQGQGQQRDARAGLISQLFVQHQQLEALVGALEKEVAQREQEAAAAKTAFERERSHPPAIFGKDEWKDRVADLEKELAERKATLAERRAVHHQGAADLAALAARTVAEQSQVKLIERAIEEARGREKVLRAEVDEIEDKLGAHKPAYRLTMQQADEALLRAWQARTDLRARIDALSVQVREAQEEAERIALDRRRLASERARLEEAVGRARAELEAGRPDALKELAARRRAGFEQHVGQVLAPLEQSLTQVDKIFIEPARQVLLQRSVGEAPKAGSLRAQAEGLAQAVAQLRPRVEPVLTAQGEVLKRVQLDFCDKVQDAVRAAWGP